MGLVGVVEPFAALLNQGFVIMNGSKMSKSKGNRVDLQAELARYGVDAIRITMLFAGPPEDDIDWADVSPAGSAKWLARVVRLTGDVGAGGGPAGAGSSGAPAGLAGGGSGVGRGGDGDLRGAGGGQGARPAGGAGRRER